MIVKCPICKKDVNWDENPFRPFCSERCKTTDLGEWASGKRAIPDDHAPNPEPSEESED